MAYISVACVIIYVICFAVGLGKWGKNNRRKKIRFYFFRINFAGFLVLQLGLAVYACRSDTDDGWF